MGNSSQSVFRVTGTLLAICFLWCFIAPCLSAWQIIPIDTEYDGYCVSLLVVLGCTIVNLADLRKGFIYVYEMLISICVGFLVLISLWGFSNHEFGYCRRHWISKSEWADMASKLQ